MFFLSNFQRNEIFWVPLDELEYSLNSFESVLTGEVGLIIQSSSTTKLLSALKKYYVENELYFNLAINFQPDYTDESKMKISCQLCDPESIVESDLIIGPCGNVLNQETDESLEFNMERYKLPTNLRNSYRIVEPKSKKSKLNLQKLQQPTITKKFSVASNKRPVDDDWDDDLELVVPGNSKATRTKKFRPSFGTPPGGDKYTNFIDMRRNPWLLPKFRFGSTSTKKSNVKKARVKELDSFLYICQFVPKYCLVCAFCVEMVILLFYNCKLRFA